MRIVGKINACVTTPDSTSYEKESYLDLKIPIILKKIKVTLGDSHRFYFTFQLSHHLPQSSKDCNRENSIKYICRATLKVPWNFDMTCEKIFIVKRQDDLNQFPILRMPQTRAFGGKNFNFFSFKNGTLLMIVELPHLGFAAGQTVPIKIKYVNECKSKIKQTEIVLRAKKCINIHGLKEKEKTVLIRYNFAGTSQTTEFICDLKIPHDIDPSELLYTNIIKIKHYIIVRGVMAGFSKNLKVKFPIVIGAIPIDGNSEHISYYYDHPEMVS